MDESIKKLLISGQRYLNLENPKETLEIFSKILNKDPTNKKDLIKKGNVLWKLGKYHYAKLCYDLALRHDPNDALALVNKELVLHFLEKYDKSIECYNKVLEMKPDNPNNTLQ